MPHGEAHLFRVTNQVRGECLVPSGFTGLGLGGGPFDGHLIDVDGHIRVEVHHRWLFAAKLGANVQSCHEIGMLELFGPADRDFESPVEHVGFPMVGSE